ncbi:hypothetical protein [Nocardia xishanensis]
MSTAARVFIDTCTLENFAVIDRMDLLEQRYAGRACWTETIQYEVQRGVGSHPHLQRILDASWLGDPIELPGSTTTVKAVDVIRRGLMSGTPPTNATDHLGEAEIIHLLETSHRGSIFITDDRPARDFARRRSLMTLETADVLADCFASGEVLCPEAYKLIEQMVDLDRGVRLPASHAEVC